jgi:YgiT-type zinc finger domain-containing protein
MSEDRQRSRKQCPRCGSSNVAEILYGYPSPELMERRRDEPIVLGGCEIHPDGPAWRCLECGEEWGAEPAVQNSGSWRSQST